MSLETIPFATFFKYIWIPVVGYLFKKNFEQDKEIQQIRNQTLTKEETRQLLQDIIGPVKEDVGEAKEDLKILREFLMNRRSGGKNEPN